MVGPVEGKLGAREVHGAKPDHQHGEGQGVEGQPNYGDYCHLGVVLLSAPKRAFCQDGHIGQAVEDCTANFLFYV